VTSSLRIVRNDGIDHKVHWSGGSADSWQSSVKRGVETESRRSRRDPGLQLVDLEATLLFFRARFHDATSFS
jgi:hypothetical protein